ncbi:MAG TPA: hypothetical protein VNG13_08390 [Mycobacteriales bacterium]|nr:hypothetical protein [Mycobacteriales bacterium]
MGVEKMSVSFDLELGRAIRLSAEQRSQSVSSWLAEAAADRLRSEALGEAVRDWEKTYGPLTDSELADAERTLERAAKRRRSGAV